MDLSELSGARKAGGRQPAQPLDPQALIAQLGSEVASTLSSALERVSALATTGRIDRDSLRALREEIALARRAGIMGQQVVRLGNGRVQIASETLDLTALTREALRQRGREIDTRGIEVRQVFGNADVNSDPTLLFALLQTVLDWAFEHAVSRIDLELAVQSWPAHAQLRVAFAHVPPDEVDTAPAPFDDCGTQLETMSWRLLQQTAAVLGLGLQRQDTPGRTQLVLEFPQTLAPRLDTLLNEGDEAAARTAQNSQALAGRHVVVLAARREVRNTVRDALRPMGLMLDFVTSVDETQALCANGLPHALVYEASLGGERFERLRAEMLAGVPGLAFIRIAEEGKGFEVLNLGGHQVASVGRDALLQSLPEALLFELSRSE